MKAKKAEHWYIIKVVVLLIALAGVFWARTALQEAAQPNSEDQTSIRAKVHIGK